MAGVFISYRREDAPGHAGRVYDRVRARFGADVVFMDVTAIEAGADFVEAIEQAVGGCDVLLAIIGPQWSGAKDDTGRRRLDNPTDFIRLEIAGALKRNVRVVPVLVDGARLPAQTDLPEDLQPLLRRNAAELRDARWDADIDQLLASLERIVKPREEPLRLEAGPGSRWLVRAIAALAVVVMGVGAALFGPRACAPAPLPTTSATTAVTPPAAVTEAPRAAQPQARETAPAPVPTTPKATVPDVVGRSLPEARDILRRAGISVARVLYRDDRTKAIDLVVLQSDVRTSAGSPPSVALTAIARAAVLIHHTPEDEALARGLLGALTSSPATAGLAIRTFQTAAVRADSVAHVTYSDAALGTVAADIARDATAWLRQNAPDRPMLTPVVYPVVASRSLIIGLPDRAGAGTSPPARTAVPDVRGLPYAEARRRLTAAGVATVAPKWLDDQTKKPTEVVGQTALAGRQAGETLVVLDVVARATMIVEYAESDRATMDRFARELTETSLQAGVLTRLQRVSAVKPAFLGKVVSAGNLPKEAASIARFASAWLTKERGRTVSIETAADRTVSSRALFFGVPPF